MKAINAGNYGIYPPFALTLRTPPTAQGDRICYCRSYHDNGGLYGFAESKSLGLIPIAEPLCKLLRGLPDRSCWFSKSSLCALRETVPAAMLVECGFFSNPGEPTANTTDSSASPDLPATMQMPLFRIREQSPRSPLPPTTGEGFFMPARHTSDCKTLFPKRISMSCSLSCSFIKTKTASILFQTLAVVLRWWRRRESNPCPEGR